MDKLTGCIGMARGGFQGSWNLSSPWIFLSRME